MLNTAIILAGGFGKRLQSRISDVPKPMAPINNTPFLNFQLRFLKHYGIKQVILSIGHLSEKISAYYKDSYEGIQISYAKEGQALGTGGGIRLAMEQTTEQRVLTLNGDSFFDIDLSAFFRFHHSEDADISIALRKVTKAGRYGNIEKNEDNRITRFEEKSTEDKSGLINGGIYIIERKLFLDNTLAQSNFSIEKDYFEKNLSKLHIKGIEFDGYFIDIGIPSDYDKAQDDFKQFKY